MAFEAITCSKCGAGMQWDGVSDVVTCSYCKTSYERKIRPEKRKTEYLMQDGSIIMTGYIPNGFSSFGGVTYNGLASVEQPVQACAITKNDHDDTVMYFQNGIVFHHSEDQRLQDQCDLFNLQNGMKRFLAYRGARDYIFFSIRKNYKFGTDFQLLQEVPADEMMTSFMQKLSDEHGTMPGYGQDFSHLIFRYKNTKSNSICIAEAITVVEYKVNQIPQMFGTYQDFIWSPVFLTMFDVREENYTKYVGEFKKFYPSITEGPAFFKMMQMANQTLQQTAVNIANARMESSFRMSQTISRTQDEISDIQRSMHQNWSDTSDRVNEKRSDYLNEVNSFISKDGYTVKADIKYDHLYQNADDPNIFLGTDQQVDHSDWDELKRKW